MELLWQDCYVNVFWTVSIAITMSSANVGQADIGISIPVRRDGAFVWKFSSHLTEIPHLSS